MPDQIMKGKNALVFGLANHRSIAWGIARALADHGARLAIAIQGDRFRSVADKLVADQSDALIIECDVQSDEQLDSCFEKVKSEMGGLDALVHSVAAAKSADGEWFPIHIRLFQEWGKAAALEVVRFG